VLAEPAVAPPEPPASTTAPAAGGDPWSDAKWAGMKWTVYRGVAYDLTAFIDRHPAGARCALRCDAAFAALPPHTHPPPVGASRQGGVRAARKSPANPGGSAPAGRPPTRPPPLIKLPTTNPTNPTNPPARPLSPPGSWLINLAIGRDCTALFESYHLRPDVAVAHLRRLPSLPDFPVAAVPRMPYPNDSELYNTIRERVRAEVFRGSEVKGAHRSGSEWAAAVILGYAALTGAAYVADTGLATGLLFGLAGAWIGLTVQHCGNHGAMSTHAAVNGFMGLCNDIMGGSSLMWRYHHQARCAAPRRAARRAASAP